MGIAPKIFSALRISIGIAISALFFSENYATKFGLGYYIMNSWAMVDYKGLSPIPSSTINMGKKAIFGIG